MRLLLDILPPAIYRSLRRFRRQFTGNYSTFAEARTACRGYDTREIARPVRQARPEFNDEEVNDRTQQILAALAVTAIKNIRVLDVGGGNAGYYYSLRRFLPAVSWTVVETAQMIAANADIAAEVEYLTTPRAGSTFDVVLMSAALQYFERPLQALTDFAQYAPFVVLNRLPLYNGSRDKLTIQRDRHGSYPAWFFARASFMESVHKRFDVVMTWRVPQDSPILSGRPVVYSGMLLKRRGSP